MTDGATAIPGHRVLQGSRSGLLRDRRLASVELLTAPTHTAIVAVRIS